jgi:hypothetical protein
VDGFSQGFGNIVLQFYAFSTSTVHNFQKISFKNKNKFKDDATLCI